MGRGETAQGKSKRFQSEPVPGRTNWAITVR